MLSRFNLARLQFVEFELSLVYKLIGQQLLLNQILELLRLSQVASNQ
jgi:hypothetical protein